MRNFPDDRERANGYHGQVRFSRATNEARPIGLLCVLILVLFAVNAAAAPAATPLWPDLKTLPPRALKIDRTDVSVDGSGQFHNVLRFSNTVWNAGEGRLEIRAHIDPKTQDGTAYER